MVAAYSAQQNSRLAERATEEAMRLTGSAVDCACVLGVPRASMTCVVLGPHGGKPWTTSEAAVACVLNCMKV